MIIGLYFDFAAEILGDLLGDFLGINEQDCLLQRNQSVGEEDLNNR